MNNLTVILSIIPLMTNYCNSHFYTKNTVLLLHTFFFLNDVKMCIKLQK